MSEYSPVELEIITIAQQGKSRVEFKKRASEILCRHLSCRAIHIYIRENNIDYTWCTKMDKDTLIGFEKADKNTPIMSEYKNRLMSMKNKKISIQSDSKNLQISVVLDIDSGKSGIVTYLREEGKPFLAGDKEICEHISKILAAAIFFRNTQAALRERIKELSCLYEITKLMNKGGESIEQIMCEAIKILPGAFQYEDIATSRIVLDGKEYRTGEEITSPYSLRSDIIIDETTRGYLEVLYNSRGYDLEEMPFLLEEQHLLDSIAKQLSLLVEEQEAAEQRRELENQLRHADRLATIGELAAGVAHEINEPLANILGFSELIQKDPGLSDQTRQDLDRIIKASMFARETVRKLLVFASQIQPGEAETDMNTIILDGIQFFEMRCLKENIRVISRLDPGLPSITADPGQLNQIFINLFVNATQAMSGGGKIEIESGLRDGYIFMSVRDSGEGISDNIRDKIFLPFFTTKEWGKGTGLGLAVVHGIVRAYKGKIEVESKKGEGARFTVYLPVEKETGNGKK